MKVVIDIEANGLDKPDQIWLIVCKDIDTGEYAYFRNITTNPREMERFYAYARKVRLWIGHNFLGYDYPVIAALTEYRASDVAAQCCDTLVVSKCVDYPRKKHSVEDYGIEFGYEKGNFTLFTDKELFNSESNLYKALEKYCVRDVDITHNIYLKYLKYISNPLRVKSLLLEHRFQLIVNDLSTNGFSFNVDKATKLLTKVTLELNTLDVQILEAFPPKEVLIREFIPKETKFGTISKTSVPRVLHDKIANYEVGKTYRHTKLEPFNPSSHKQLIDVLSDAKWSPVNRTKTHIELDRETSKLKRERNKTKALDLRLQENYNKLSTLAKYGWKIDEANLATLPEEAPAPARLLAKRILLESRRRTLTEWLGLVRPDTQRIHGKFYGIGAWTHRMAHQNPNTANIPTDAKLYGHDMRALWRAPRNRLLVGVDAESIQLRIFAHYIDDQEFTNALVNGKKEDKSDPHSLNQRILKAATRNHAKRFIFAYLLGAGVGKLSEILDLPETEGQAALDRLIERYEGLSRLKETIIPADAKRGWFCGLDGRAVKIPGESLGARKHLCMSGYLQNGEAVVMKMATLRWYAELQELSKEFPKLYWLLVNFVHDEWQTEVNNNMELAIRVAKIQADALRYVGEELKLKCPLAGSYWNDDVKDFTIGTSWVATH